MKKLGFYKKAANAYVSFVKSYPSDSKASDFWYNAGVIFDALNDVGSAVYSYQRHFALSKKQERHEIFYLIGFMYEKNRRWQKAIDYYKQYLKSSSSNKIRLVKASFTVADIYANRLRNPGLAKVWHQKTLGLYKRLKTGVSYGARSHFYITKNFYDRFSQVKIPARAKQQEAAVAKKIRLLKDLEKALKPIIRYDDGEQIIACLTLIGQANQDMAKAIYQAPIPKSLNKKGRIQYRAGIKKVIWPYIKQAVKHYQLALKKSSQLQVYSEWLKKAYSGLSEIRVSHGEFQRFLPVALAQEVLPLQILDNTGTVAKGVFQTLAKSFKYGLSSSDFEALSQAMATKREDSVLKAVSAILNKDPNNVLAINSLAFFYLQNNRWGLGTLILNRLSSKKSNAPIIMNNLAMVSLKYRDVREAITFLKKALSANRSYHIARVNLASIFIQQYDYHNAYSYYDDSYDVVAKRWSPKNKKTIALLNSYGVALTGAKHWDEGQFVFKSLSAHPSPLTEVLFNYAVFLTEKSRGEDKKTAQNSLLKAKELVDELSLYSGSARLKRKVKLLSRSISARLKELKLAYLEKNQKSRKVRGK